MKKILDFGQCKRLKELGCQSSSTGWFYALQENTNDNNDVGEKYKAYTIGDLIEAIYKIHLENDYRQGICIYPGYGVVFPYETGELEFVEDCPFERGHYEEKTEFAEFTENEELIDNLYDCLCWCLENLKGGAE